MEKENKINFTKQTIDILYQIKDSNFMLKSGIYGYYIDMKDLKFSIKENKNPKFNKYYAYICQETKLSLSIRELNEYSIIEAAQYVIKKYNLK